METVKRCGVVVLCIGLVAGMAQVGRSEAQNLMDPTLTELGYIPLPDLGLGTYTRDGHTELGGLYPDGWTIRPPQWEALALEIATNQIQPLDAEGNPDPEKGKIVMMSAGMSNTNIFFEGRPDLPHAAFHKRTDNDPARNPQLVVVNGAQGTRAAMDWEPVDSTTYSTMESLLAKAKVTPAQVQVVWVLHALRETGPFPAYAQELERYLEATARNLKVHFPNIKLVYYSSRERAYLMYRKGEPDCYEAGFAVRWMIEKQMQGDPELNWDPARGEVKAPLILWGPYLWCDGLKPRSDGLIWTCCEPTSDVYNNPHPESSGAQKGADQIYAFFKTDPTTTPWYLRKVVTGQAPEVTAGADVAEGPAPLTVHFSADANDPDGRIVEYAWTFGDGTFSYNPNGAPGGEPYYLNPNPVKTFCCPGLYTAYLTVTDDAGNAVTREIRVTVGDGAPQSTYTYGAKFEPPAGRVLHGMGQWEPYNATLLPLLPAEVRPASKLIFVTIGDTPRGWRPEGIATTFQNYDRDGFIPHIDIALRGNQPTIAELAAMPDPLFGIDDEVASTTRFDSRIEDLARIIKEFGRPVIVRIGGEFNGPWNGYHPYDYPKAFRKIVDMFRAAQVENVAFVWCYEPAAPDDFDEQDRDRQHKWFPGEDVIDWFSIDWFNKDDFSGPLAGTGGRQGTGLTAHGRSRRFLDMAVAYARPVMIAESSPCRYDLSDRIQADAAWQEWFEPYFAILAERSEIKWFHLISYDWTQASRYAEGGWQNNDFTASPIILQKLIEELRKPQYLHAPDKLLLKDYADFPGIQDSQRQP
jgi:hypothetical protein